MPDVILPVLDEAEALPGVLGAMPAGYRPIVVDNGSSDGSDAIAAELGAMLVREPRRGFGAACFAGLTAATADVVCFMDADASFDPRELDRVSQTLTSRISILGDRYSSPLPQLTDQVATLAARVDGHLRKMEASWK